MRDEPLRTSMLETKSKVVLSHVLWVFCEENGKIPFLDCLVKRDSNRLQMTIYRKLTHTNQSLDQSSYNLTSHKATTIQTLTRQGKYFFVLVDDLVRGWLAHGTLTHRASERQKLLDQQENLLSRTTGWDFFEPWIKKMTNTWHFTFSWLV